MNQCCQIIPAGSNGFRSPHRCKRPGILRAPNGGLYCHNHAPSDAAVDDDNKFVVFRARGISPDYYKLAQLLRDRAQDKKLTFAELDALGAILNK